MMDFIKGRVQTSCDGIKKITDINFASINNINVDNDSETGNNGNDISIQYILLPWIQFDPIFAIGALFTVSVERIGDEIKNKNFSISLELSNGDINLGFLSPNITRNEIPDFTRLSFMFLFNPFEKTNGFAFYLKPEYNTGTENKKLILFANYKNEQNIISNFSFEFDPPIEIQLNLYRTKTDGRWSYHFQRKSSINSKITTSFERKNQGEFKEITLTINKIPTDFSFELEMTPFIKGGGKFIYESNKMYDIELTISTNELGLCKYASMINTPRKIVAEWIPTKENGYYSISMESNGTKFLVMDNPLDPEIKFIINDISTIDVVSYWNFTNPGDFIVKKNTNLDVDLDFRIGEWMAKLNARPTANKISTSWLIGVTGYIMIDTDYESLTTIDLLIKGEELGLHTIGESFKSEDFDISWTLWPPVEWDLSISGNIEFISLVINIYLNGDWLHLWPLIP